MNKTMYVGTALMALTFAAQAGVVDFENYSEGTTFSDTTHLLDSTNGTSGFWFRQSGGNNTNVVENGMLKLMDLDVNIFSAGWVRDDDLTVFDDVTNSWYRSVDVKLSADSKVGQEFAVALFNASAVEATGVNITPFNTNYLFRVWTSQNSGGDMEIRLMRRADADSVNVRQQWNFSTDAWVDNGATVQLVSIDDTLTVEFSYDGVLKTYSLALATNGVVFEAIDDMPASEFFSSVGGANQMLFAVGDMWKNSKQGTVGYIDNLSNVMPVIVPPESIPATILGFAPVSESVLKMTVDIAEPSWGYVKSATNLTAGTFANVPHSIDGQAPFVATNLSYSAVEGDYRVVYLQANDSQQFYRIGGE